MTARDLLLSKRIPGNTLDQQAASRRALTELANRDISLPQLSGIATDFGLINAGTIVMGNGQPLGAGFTGMMRFADPLEWPTGSGKFWTDIAFNTDVMTFGVSALDGKLYAAAGALFVDMSGIATIGLDYFWNMQAAFNANTNYAKTGMFLPYSAYGNNPAPAWQTTYQTDLGSDLFVNGSFETGSFTGWTTGGTGTWSVITAPPQPQAGTYCAKIQTGSSQTGTITQANRIAISALEPYEFIAYVSFAGGASEWSAANCTVRIDFYDNTVGGNLLDSYTYWLPLEVFGAWSKFWKILTSPASAAAVQLTFTFTRSGVIGSFPAVIDAVSVKNIQSYSQISMQPSFTVEGSGVQMEELQEDSTGSPTVIQPAPGFAHLFARRKTHALAVYRSTDDVLHLHHGDVQPYQSWSNTSSQDIYSRDIAMGALGPRGSLVCEVEVQITNGTPSAKTSHIIFSFGATTILDFATGSIGSGNFATYRFRLSLENDNNTGAQSGNVIVQFRNPNSTTIGAATVQQVSFTGAVDTAFSTETLLVHVNLSAASSSLVVERMYASMDGPNYGA